MQLKTKPQNTNKIISLRAFITMAICLTVTVILVLSGMFYYNKTARILMENYEIESEPGFRAGYGNSNLLDTTEWNAEDEKTQQVDAMSGTWKSAEKTYNNMSSLVFHNSYLFCIHMLMSYILVMDLSNLLLQKVLLLLL